MEEGNKTISIERISNNGGLQNIYHETAVVFRTLSTTLDRNSAAFLSIHDTSEQSPLCSDVFYFYRNKKRHPPAPLLLLSKPNPLSPGFGGLAFLTTLHRNSKETICLWQMASFWLFCWDIPFICLRTASTGR